MALMELYLRETDGGRIVPRRTHGTSRKTPSLRLGSVYKTRGDSVSNPNRYARLVNQPVPRKRQVISARDVGPVKRVREMRMRAK